MKTISFVIPCYNEEKRIEKTFEALKEAQLPRGLKLSEIIFVDDGSTDSTFKKITDHTRKMATPVTIISYKNNEGKGHAIKEGMLASTSDYALFFDADISTPLSEIKKIAPYIKRNIPVVIGTRKNGKSTVIVHQPLYRELLGRAFTQMTRIFLQIKVTDFTCGFKAFSKAATDGVFSKSIISGWGYDAEILFLAQKNKYRIQEVPVLWSNDEGTKVKLSSAIIKTLWELLEIRLNHNIKPGIQFAVSNFQFAVKSLLNLKPNK